MQVDGWNVIATCRTPAKADALTKLAQQHQSIRIEALDVLDSASIAGLTQRLQGTALDLLINNAGIYGDKDQQSFGQLDAKAWDEVLRTNTIAPIMLSQALLPLVLKGHDKKIVVITSLMGSIKEGGAGAILYRSSKAGLNAAMHSIALSLKEQGVKLVGLHPGWVKTDMGGQGASIEPQTSIAGMRKVIAGLTDQQSGGFIGYDGRDIPW